VNPAARDAYLRGRYYWFSDRYEKSREFFQEAIRLDPNYAPAFSGLATVTRPLRSPESRDLDTIPLAEAASRRRWSSMDSLAEAHHASAAIKIFLPLGLDARKRRANAQLS